MAKEPTRAAIEVDTLHHQVRAGMIAHGKRGSGPGEFHYPAGIAVLGGRAYVADSWNHRVQAFDIPDWKFAFEFGDFFCPKWIGVVEDHGQPLLAIVDTNNARVCFHEPDGRRLGFYEFNSRRFPVAARVPSSETIEIVFEDDHVGSFEIERLIRPPWWTTKLDKPVSLVRDPRGFVYVSDFGRRTVEKFDADGKFIAEVLGPDVLKLPGKMVVNNDDLLVTDRLSNAVFIYNTMEATNRRWDYVFDGPGFIGRNSYGEIWVGTYKEQPDPNGATLPVFDSNYQFLRTVTFGESHQPTSIAFAGDRVLIGDHDARAVFTFDADGEFLGPLRDEPYDSPVWSVVADSDNHIYVGIGPVADVLWAADLNRLYYIDCENSAVHYSDKE